MGNSSGSSREVHTLNYFDRLPRSARAAVANARFDWALRHWLTSFERGQLSAKQLVAKIQEADARFAAKERRRTWGADYPTLKGELPEPKRRSRNVCRR